MNVRELIVELSKYPDDMPVIGDMYSDYMSLDVVELVKGVQINSWIMRSHPTMSEANKSKEKTYLYLGT